MDIEPIEIDWDRENELCAKRSLYRELIKKDKLTQSDKDILAAFSKDPDVKLLTEQFNKDKMTYNFICDFLKKEGWTKETTFINEKTKYIISLHSAKPGKTALVIDIACPKDQKILIRGTENGDIQNFKDAYTIKLTLMDSSKNEISWLTKIRITKEKTTELAEIKCFYADIRREGDDCLYYRPRKNILLEDDDHLFVYVIGESIGKELPDKAIDKDHISFSIKADIFAQ